MPAKGYRLVAGGSQPWPGFWWAAITGDSIARYLAFGQGGTPRLVTDVRNSNVDFAADAAIKVRGYCVVQYGASGGAVRVRDKTAAVTILSVTCPVGDTFYADYKNQGEAALATYALPAGNDLGCDTNNGSNLQRGSFWGTIDE